MRRLLCLHCKIVWCVSVASVCVVVVLTVVFNWIQCLVLFGRFVLFSHEFVCGSRRAHERNKHTNTHTTLKWIRLRTFACMGFVTLKWLFLCVASFTHILYVNTNMTLSHKRNISLPRAHHCVKNITKLLYHSFSIAVEAIAQANVSFHPIRIEACQNVLALA